MKKIISILICIQIALFPAFAFAANVGGWSLSNPVAKGASTVYDATKNVVINGKKYIKESSVKITPSASAVAKVLARGAAGYALSVAVEQLLGSVDWVLDPANNQIRYTEPLDPNERYVYKFQGVDYTGPDAVCNAYFALQAPTSIKLENKKVTIKNNGASVVCTATQTYSCGGGTRECIDSLRYEVYRTAIIDGPTEEEKTLPLDVVAQQVISNAAGGDTAAQAATTAAAADIVAEAENDDAKARPIASQAESNATTKPADAAEAEKANEAQGEAKPNEANPEATDLSLTFPIFCNWAPTICEAAQTVISFPTTLTDWWNTTNQKADSWASSIAEAWASVKEWATGEPDLQENQTDLPIEEQTLDRDPSSFDTDYIVLGSQCPSFEPYTVEVGPISKTLSMDLSPLCDFAAQVRPAILGMSYLTAAGIVVAAIRET